MVACLVWKTVEMMVKMMDCLLVVSLVEETAQMMGY